MRKLIKHTLLAASGIAGLAAASPVAMAAVPAATVNSVYLFTATNPQTQINTDGANPAGITIGPDGALYGLVYNGGPNGLGGIVRVTTTGQESLIYSFTSGAAASFGKLVLGSDGNFYGSRGVGTNARANAGEVFQVTPSGAFKVLTTLKCTDTPKQCSDERSKKPDQTGWAPNGDLLETTPGTFVGAVTIGAAEGVGGIFSVTSSGSYSLLASFPQSSGGFPNGHLVQDANGVLYGTFGAALVKGAPGGIFSLTNGTISILHTFKKRTEGFGSQAGLVLASDGNLYGTTGFGGPKGYGTVFKSTTTGQVTVLADFDGASNGGTPMDALTEGSDGLLYGETPYDGAAGSGYLEGAGILFRIAKDGAGGLQVLYNFQLSNPNFTSPTGAVPNGALALASDGTFYGASQDNCGFQNLFDCGPDNSGAVWSFHP
jgi:uncharacterized repeat protein (TIGR03803 family)